MKFKFIVSTCIFVLIISGNFCHVYSMPPDPLEKATINTKSMNAGKIEAGRFTAKEKVAMIQIRNDIGKLQALQKTMQNNEYLAHRINYQKSHTAKQFATYLRSLQFTKIMKDVQEVVDDISYCDKIKNADTYSQSKDVKLLKRIRAESIKQYKNNLRCRNLTKRIKKAERELNIIRNRNVYYIQELKKTHNADMESVRNKRQEYQTAFENFDQKTNQLFTILSTVLKSMKEMQSAVTRNLL